MRAVIAAARTGGHINPGLAIAAKIKEKQPNSEILFIGTESGLEQDLVPRAGFKLETIEAYGFNRKICLENLIHITKTFLSIGKAKKILKEFKPDVVIGTGGYICMPVIMAAHSLKIKTMLHESNAFPGASVRMLSKKVDRVLLGFEDASKRLPNAKTVTTGTPTKVKRLYFSQKQKEEKLAQLGLNPNLQLVLAFGGSQGAKVINEALIYLIKEGTNKTYQIMWACGQKQYDQIKESIDISKLENTKIVPYIYNMEEIMNLCDVVVSRSGALTITEIATVGKPAVFIPLAIATENHQEYNAKVLANVGAAKIILEKDLNKQNLAEAIEQILSSKERAKMEENARGVFMPNAAEKIYKEIIEVLSEK